MRDLPPKVVRLPVLLLALLLFAACGTTRSLREAQSAFNDAATADMQLRQVQDDSTAALLGVRDGGYRMTIAIINGLDNRQRTQLNSDKLWGTALMLKAMSQWRIGDYDDAKASAVEATSKFAEQLGTRDAAVLGAMDGLIALDQADAKLIAVSPGRFKCEYEDVNDLVSSGLASIEAQRRTLSAREPVQRYLIQAKLAGHRTRQVAEDCDTGARQPSDPEIRAKENDFCRLRTSDASDTTTSYWEGLLGGPFSCP